MNQIYAFLCCLLLTETFAPTGAQTTEGKSSAPAYTRLSDEAILKMGLSEFSFRYGKDAIGSMGDDRLHYYAGCLGRRSDRVARGISAATAAKLTALRTRLAAWDEMRFTPAQRFTGGMLEEGHHSAAAHVEREQLLERLVPQLSKTRAAGLSPDAKEARAEFRQWVTASREDAVPLPEQLADADAEEKAAVRMRYQSWYARLKEKARGIEITAATLPADAGARLLRYACAL